ncbi:molybdate ABC transporter substrate-binding protein [Tritonibacter scottomollicae]|uniref:molybdate ABC transporter substrate-binding protein n=1 Tax=Tritonibacter scottomollicae TaxID=483013 RepID=UPI003AA80E57
MTPFKLKNLVRWMRVLCLIPMIVLPSVATAEPLRVFAAASLKTALDEISATYETDTATEVSISYGGSSLLARQIGAGAPADVFISANVGWMDDLARQGRIDETTRLDLLRNSLSVIAARDKPALSSLADLQTALGTGKLAMAQTNAVPAGIYGKAALSSANIWQDLQAQVAQTDNVRSALALVASGAAPYGIVYQTDARAETRVTVAFPIPDSMHPPIIYPVAAINTNDRSRAFIEFLTSQTADHVFEAQGFTPVEYR